MKMLSPLDSGKDTNNLLWVILFSMIALFGYEYYTRATTSPPAAVEAKAEASAEIVPAVIGQQVAPATLAEKITLTSADLEVVVNTQGAQLTHAELPNVHVENDDSSANVALLNDNGIASQMDTGWAGQGVLTPGPKTVWHVAERGEKSLTLEWQNGQGQTFGRTFVLNGDNYSLTVTDTVRNASGMTLELSPFAQVHRIGLPVTKKAAGFLPSTNSRMFNGAEGYVAGDFTRARLGKLDKKGPQQVTGEGGWWGLTGDYFLAAIVANEGVPATYQFRSTPRAGGNIYSGSVQYTPMEIAANNNASFTHTLYIGPKEQHALVAVGDSLDKSIDFGWFRILSKPLHDFVLWLNTYIGNFGVTIILVTLLVRGAMFPLSAKSYIAMNKMKDLQPKMKALKEKFADDQQALGLAMMQLYKTEKINPAAGCWPVLLQIPVFFAFYKMILVSYEFRHEPFMLWITDLSARDPFFVLPVLMGISMYVQMQMTPTPQDETQRIVMKIMPFMFTVMFLFFPSGLVLYWLTSNVFTIGQQWLLRKKH